MSRIDDPSIQSKGVGEQLRNVGEQVKGAAQEQFANLRESAQEYYEQGRDKAMQWEQSFEDVVREQPIKSVLIACGVGLVLGFIWRRS